MRRARSTSCSWALGLISEPSRLFVYNDIGTFIVLTYVYMPFAILVLYASLERFDYTQLTAAQDLGASPSRAFRHVLLPQIRPGLITAAIFVFIPILGEFLTPSMVGGASGFPDREPHRERSSRTRSSPRARRSAS